MRNSRSTRHLRGLGDVGDVNFNYLWYFSRVENQRWLMTLTILPLVLGSIHSECQQRSMSRVDPTNSPESFFVGIRAVSDASPFWFDYVLDVMPGTDTAHVTLLRIAPLDNVCSDRITIKAKEATI